MLFFLFPLCKLPQDRLINQLLHNESFSDILQKKLVYIKILHSIFHNENVDMSVLHLHIFYQLSSLTWT